MDPLITKSDTRLGKRVFFNFLKSENSFLTQNVDLSWEFGAVEKPLDDYFSLPKDTLHVPSLDYGENTKTAEFVAARLEDYRTNSSFKNLQRSKILVFLYTLAQSESGRFLFVTRFSTRFCDETRKYWSYCLRFGEYHCCFKNYCKEFNLGNPIEVSDTMIPEIDVLEEYCYFKEKHVEVITEVWCYRLDVSLQEKPQKTHFGFNLKEDGFLGGFTFLSQFAYGSNFKFDITEKKNMTSNPISFNCRDLYTDLSEKSQFFAFIRDSFNTSWLNMNFFEDKLDPISFKLLGCSFYF